MDNNDFNDYQNSNYPYDYNKGQSNDDSANDIEEIKATLNSVVSILNDIKQELAEVKQMNDILLKEVALKYNTTEENLIQAIEYNHLKNWQEGK